MGWLTHAGDIMTEEEKWENVSRVSGAEKGRNKVGKKSREGMMAKG